MRLRRLEQEQLMFLVMKWLFPRLKDNWKHWEDAGQFSVEWEDALEYGEYISFVQEAIDWAKRCPNPMGEDSELEIRQVFEADDFGAEFTPELREQEDRLRARIEEQQK